jgi:hypothetical protein
VVLKLLFLLSGEDYSSLIRHIVLFCCDIEACNIMTATIILQSLANRRSYILEKHRGWRDQGLVGNWGVP